MSQDSSLAGPPPVATRVDEIASLVQDACVELARITAEPTSGVMLLVILRVSFVMIAVGL